MKTSELIWMLKKAGCELIHHAKRHDEWYSPITGNYFQLPRHKSKELAVGTAESIMKKAGLK